MSTALVTGAAGGIGQAIAARFADQGHDLLLADLDPEVIATAERLAASSGRRAEGVVADLADADGRDAVLAAAPSLDILVNNAGITRDALLTRMTDAEFGAVVDVNLGAAYQLTLALLDRLTDGGSVVSLSSRSYLGNVGQFNYAASKGGIVGMTRALALTHAPRLRFNAVAPGFIDTEMTRQIPERIRSSVLSRIPVGRAGSTAEVAEAVCWLASPGASYVTGQVLFVCGGRGFGGPTS